MIFDQSLGALLCVSKLTQSTYVYSLKVFVVCL